MKLSNLVLMISGFFLSLSASAAPELKPFTGKEDAIFNVQAMCNMVNNGKLRVWVSKKPGIKIEFQRKTDGMGNIFATYTSDPNYMKFRLLDSGAYRVSDQDVWLVKDCDYVGLGEGRIIFTALPQGNTVQKTLEIISSRVGLRVQDFSQFQTWTDFDFMN